MNYPSGESWAWGAGVLEGVWPDGVEWDDPMFIANDQLGLDMGRGTAPKWCGVKADTVKRRGVQ